MISVSVFKEPLVKALAISLLLHGVLFGVLNNYNVRKPVSAAQEFKSVQIEFRNVISHLVESGGPSIQELPVVEETPEPVAVEPVVVEPVVDAPLVSESESPIVDDVSQVAPQVVSQVEEGTPGLESVLTDSERNAASPISPVSQPGDEYSDLESMSLSNIRIPAPVYPARAKQMGWEGDVQIHFTVNSKGRPDVIEINQSSGYEVLDQAVLDTVKKRWRFSKENAGLKLKKTFSFRLI
ncbi:MULTISPECIES: energy transducer TonB [unclassified Oceanispirochaeta]|uniref:energy transducer TonB n=1 Tax=unclassified Oceanispirochaeta TaxID=2635722 RepID=UPI000E09B7EA|nr:MULTISPECIES: energy transducer TonB [unclassified Oceanispirochaeta]MBF9016357.1 energy transducer TonB [Oceanispirochaeta sp. M2]NPD72819.1 energy transducer TonB [Oceanispirochaeta sp. M1]RDG31663.1 energy transducer TonB [Oceanispirochaeta sp. M1]